LQGDGNIRYYEVLFESPYIRNLSQYQSPAPQRDLGITLIAVHLICLFRYTVIGKFKAKFHYTSWFGASSELAPNMFGASSELASVMEFGFYQSVKVNNSLRFRHIPTCNTNCDSRAWHLHCSYYYCLFSLFVSVISVIIHKRVIWFRRRQFN